MKMTLLPFLLLLFFQNALFGQEKRIEQLKEAYSMITTAKIGLKKTGEVYPELQSEIVKILKGLEESKIEKAFQGLLVELKATLEDDYAAFEKEISEDTLKDPQLVPGEIESAKLMISNIAKVKDGRLPTAQLRTLVSCHAGYQKDPVQEMKDGFIAGYSTKMDPEKRKVHFLLSYPGSWKPMVSNAPYTLFTADNKAGFGKARMILDVAKAPDLSDPEYKDVTPVMFASLLIPEGSKVLEKGKATLGGFPAGRVLLSFTPKGAEKSNRIIAYSGLIKGQLVTLKISLLNDPTTTFEKQIAKYDPLLEFIAAKLEVE